MKCEAEKGLLELSRVAWRGRDRRLGKRLGRVTTGRGRGLSILEQWGQRGGDKAGVREQEGQSWGLMGRGVVRDRVAPRGLTQ